MDHYDGFSWGQVCLEMSKEDTVRALMLFDISLVRQNEWAPIDWFVKSVAVLTVLRMAGGPLTWGPTDRAENQ